MKPSLLSTTRLSLPLATAIAALLAAPSAHATNYYWDIDGLTTAGAGSSTPNGTWATGGTTWSTDSTGSIATPAYTTLVTDDLFFSAGTNATGAYTVTLTTTQNAQSLTFEDGSVTISGTGGIINLGGSGTIAANAGLSATIGNNTTTKIAGSAGLRKIANGTLTLNGSAVNTFTGGVTVNGGTLGLDYTNLATPTNLVDSANALQINNAALTITGKNVAAATTAQTFAGTSLGAGINTVNIAKGALATSATLNLGALTANSGSLTTFSPTTAWTTTASTTEKVFISAGGSVPTLPSGATTAFVNAGVFHRVAGGAAGTLRLAAVNSSGQLLLKGNAGNVSASIGVDPTGSYQYGDATSYQLTNTAASIYGLLLNATSNGVTLTTAASGTLTLNSIIQIKAAEGVNINAGTGGNLIIGSEKNLVIAMDNTAGLGIGAPIANNGSTGGVGGTASALTIYGNTSITPGTVTLGGANTYTGPTTITRGTLALSNANALATTSGLTLGGASAATLSSSGDITGITINGAITAANGGLTSTISFSRNTANAGTLTLSGGITGGGGNVTFTTPNVNSGGNVQTITLGGGVGSAGGYGGSTTLGVGNTNNAITLRSGIDNALPTTTVLTFAQNNGVGSGRATTFDLNGFNQTLAGLSNTGVVPENRNMTVTSATAATLTINSTASQTFGGRTISTTVSTIGTNTRAAITGAISLVKNGTGTFTLGGTLSGGAVAAGNTFTGDTKITAGILVLGESLSIQNSAFDTGSSITGDTTNGLRAGIGGTGVTTLTLGGLTGGNNFSTRFTTTTGGYTGLTGLTLNPGTGVTNSYSADIGNGNGSMTLTKSGLGTQVLTNTQSYTGATTITAGTLQLDGSTNASSTVGIGTAGTLSGSGTVNGNATLTGNGIINKSAGTIAGTLGVTGGNWNGAGAVTGLVTSSSGTFNIGAGANLTANGDLSVTGGTIAAGNSASTITGSVDYTSSSNSTFAGIIAGSGKTLTLNNSAATLSLSGASTYTGVTNVNAGTLVIGSTNALGTTAGNTVIASGAQVFMATASLAVAEPFNIAGSGVGGLGGAIQFGGGVSGMSISGAVTLSNNATIKTDGGAGSTLSGGIDVGSNTLTFTVDGGATNTIATTGISGTGGSIIKGSSGTLILNASNTYDGTTTVSGGKLTVGSTGTINGTSGVSIGAGEFNYNSATALSQGVSFSGTGGKLSGSGTITPAVTVTAGNTLAPGNSIGTLSFGSGLTLAGTYSVELGTVNADPALSLSDRSAVTGDLAVGGNLTLVDNANANSQGSAAAGAYRIATYTGNLSGTFASVTNPLSATLHEKVVYGPASGGGNVDLNIYRLAAGSTANTNIGKVRVGDSLTGSLTTTNSATADGFSENLNASVGSNAGDVNASSGTVSGVIAGANASTMSVGLDTTSSGAKSGSVLVSYTSDGTGTSGYGTTANGSQTVTVTGDVYELASATLGGADVGSLVGSSPTYTLDFGSGLALNTLYTMSFSIQNGAVANAFKDSLTGDYSLAGAGFGTDAVDFSGLAAGAAANMFSITFMTNSEGSYSGTFTFDGTSVQSGLSDVSVGDFTIALTAIAVPEPRAALLGGLGLLALLRRRRIS